MGILDKLNPFKKKERIETPKDLEGDLPENLRQFQAKPEEEPIPETPSAPASETPPVSPQEGYMPPEFGLGPPSALPEKRISKEQHEKIKTDLESRHRLELILNKLEVIDTRLKLIEEKLKIRRF